MAEGYLNAAQWITMEAKGGGGGFQWRTADCGGPKVLSAGSEQNALSVKESSCDRFRAATSRMTALDLSEKSPQCAMSHTLRATSIDWLVQ